MWKSIKRSAASACYYNTVKLVHIKSRKLGALHYGIQLLIFVYIIVYVIVLKKGYQTFSAPIGTIAIKTKGNAFVGSLANGTFEIWDANDVTYPALEADASFLTTNFIWTSGQTRSQCAGTAANEACDAAGSCPVLSSTTNGLTTGQCVNTATLANVTKCGPGGNLTACCELYAWCPLENDIAAAGNLLDITDFTVFVKQNIQFPAFDITLTTATGAAPTPGLNLFTVGGIVAATPIDTDPRYTMNYFADVQAAGAAIAVVSSFNCDLDRPQHECHPKFEFVRLDDPSSFSPGFNFRVAYYYRNEAGVLVRDLVKLFGLRLVFILAGAGGKFSVIPLLQNIGSGLALLTVATIIADLVALNCTKNRKKFQKAKVLKVTDEDMLDYDTSGEDYVEDPSSINEVRARSATGAAPSSVPTDESTPLLV